MSNSKGMHDVIRAQVAGLTEGQRIFMANHMYKHYGVYPTKLKDAVEAVKEPDYISVGTLVKVVYADHKVNELKPGMLGFIKDIDVDDPELPYLVLFVQPDGDEICDWAPPGQLIVA